MIKYAKLEEILEIKEASERMPFDINSVPGDALSKFSAMKTRESEDGYLYVRCRAISSRVNKNHDGWPSDELAKSYKSFIGKPIFVDHNNSNPDRARGVIVDSRLHVEDLDKISSFDEYYSSAPENHKPPTWIELLLEVDAKTFPKLATAVKKGHIDAVSMGANIETSVCSICDNSANSPIEYCKHLSSKGAEFEITSANGEKMMKKAYEDCHKISFFEISFVFDPADPTALISEKSDNKLSKAANAPEGYSDDMMIGDTPPDPLREELKALLLQKGFLTPESIPGAVGTLDDLQVQQLLQTLKTAKRKSTVEKKLALMQVTNPNDADRELNYVPQSDLISSPADVDTLKSDQGGQDVQCPNCHSDVLKSDAQGMLKCPSCSWVQPPHPLDNPDLGIHEQGAGQEPTDEQQLINNEEEQVTFFNTQSNVVISEIDWQVITNTVIIDRTSAILPKKKVLNPSFVTRTEDPQDAKIVADQKSPVTSSTEKVKDMETEKDTTGERKLLVAFSLADEFVQLGLVEENYKLAFVAELEEETNEALEARKATITLVKEAGLSRPVSKVASLPKLPKFAGYKGEAAFDPDDVPFESAFM